jgi:hypothetical protein
VRACLGAGIYDFRKAYDEVKIDGIGTNIEADTGMAPRMLISLNLPTSTPIML